MTIFPKTSILYVLILGVTLTKLISVCITYKHSGIKAPDVKFNTQCTKDFYVQVPTGIWYAFINNSRVFYKLNSK